VVDPTGGDVISGPAFFSHAFIPFVPALSPRGFWVLCSVLVLSFVWIRHRLRVSPPQP
jgi:hypothetical protein